jgi:hypothetical protein
MVDLQKRNYRRQSRACPQPQAKDGLLLGLMASMPQERAMENKQNNGILMHVFN